MKYEHVYLHIYDDAVQLYEGLSGYFDFYSETRPTRDWPMKHRRPFMQQLKEVLFYLNKRLWRTEVYPRVEGRRNFCGGPVSH